MATPSRTSSGGVRNLRAMFENSADGNSNAVVSPSSARGRSPAGSVSSTGDSQSRPLSKVRTSFVSVDPSGRIPIELPGIGQNSKPLSERLAGSPFAQRRASSNVSEDRQGEKEVINELRRHISPAKETKDRDRRSSGIEAIPEDAVEMTPVEEKTAEQAMHQVEEKPEQKEVALPEETKPTSQPDKPVSAEEEDVDMKPSDPKDVEAVSGGAGLPPPTEVLPPLKQEEDKTATDEPEAPEETVEPAEAAETSAEAPKSEESAPSEPTPAPEPEQEKAEPVDEPIDVTLPHARPSEVPIIEETPASAVPKSPVEEPAEQTNGTRAPAAEEKVVENTPAKTEPKKEAPKFTGKPAPINTKSTKLAPAKKSPSHPKTPTTHGSSSVSAKPSPAAKPTAAVKSPAHPKPAPKKDIPASKPVASHPKPTEHKAPAAKTSRSSLRDRTSIGSTMSTATTKPAHAGPVSTRIAPKAPAQEHFTKPRPKSPTRPVRLADRLMAPTAASAAKHNAEEAANGTGKTLNRKPSVVNKRPESRATTTSTHPKPAKQLTRGPSTNTKKPAPRPSTASTHAGEGKQVDEGFLARMMRPTASSASKVKDETKKAPAGIVPKVKAATNGVKKAVTGKKSPEEKQEHEENHKPEEKEQEAEAGAEEEHDDAPSLPAIESVASPYEEQKGFPEPAEQRGIAEMMEVSER